MLESVSQAISIPLFQVDAHNIVPAWTASSKQEWSARTFRTKIHRLLPAFLEEIPAPSVQDTAWKGDTDNDWEAAMLAGTAGIDLNDANSWTPPPGEEAAISTLLDFAANRLEAYETARNDPGKQGQSGLSPYLHFGQIAAQRAAIEVISRRNTSEATDRSAGAFLEELIVRRELSENFCRYNPHYDSVIGFPQWARTTLDEHRDDPRDYVYSMKELENAATHDEIWNAAQTEMVITGKMHGYLRMYWAKKILEWSPSPDAALFAVIELNDRHELDGRDPNGYAGAAWSVGGVHDRAFARRAVFGKIRYMSGGGLRRKFDMKAYLRRIEQLLQ
jgi:deoxyribodipyrimidine photo-lyase